MEGIKTIVKQRQSNFELLRILSMSMIICGHFLQQTNATESTIVINRMFSYIFGSAGRVSTNIFLILGLWFMVDKKFKMERVIKLWLQVLIICAPLATITYIISPQYRSTLMLLHSFLPIIGRPLWYASSYMILMLCSPFLQYICKRVSWDFLKRMVITFGIFICLMPSLLKYQNEQLCSIIWFFYMYFLIYYIKKTEMIIALAKTKTLILGGYCLYILLALLKFQAYEFPEIKAIYILGKIASQWLTDYKSFPNLFIALMVFISFYCLKIKNRNNINFLAGATFSIYIYHQTPIFKDFYWNVILKIPSYINQGGFLIASVLFLLIIYFVGIIIDVLTKVIRNFIFENIVVVKKVCIWCDRFYAPIIYDVE